MTRLKKANIDKVIEIIRDENKYFNMNCHTIDDKYYCYHTEAYRDGNYEKFDFKNNSCGSASCICSWSNYIRLTEKGEEIESLDVLCKESSAIEWLGLDSGIELFYANYPDVNRYDITRDQAINVLENLKETGVVDWKSVL